MDSLNWEGDPPDLRSPILVAAFSGWNDAASAATSALEAMTRTFEPTAVAHVDPEEFFDFQVTRPTVRLVDGALREIDWPQIEFSAAPTESPDHDIVLLSGPEPNLRWRGFSATVLEVAERLGVDLVVTLGALLADVAHTRPVPVTGLASDSDLVEPLGLERSAYEGPTGIVGVLHDACRARNLDSISLWAAVPHYVAAVPNPKAALALLHRLEDLTGLPIQAPELEQAIEPFERQVDAAVAANSEIEELVRSLESEQDEAMGDEGDDVPSGDTIARAFQRFLREQGDG